MDFDECSRFLVFVTSMTKKENSTICVKRNYQLFRRVLSLCRCLLEHAIIGLSHCVLREKRYKLSRERLSL